MPRILFAVVLLLLAVSHESDSALSITAQRCADGVIYIQDPTCAAVGSGTDFAWTGTVPNFNGLVEDVDTVGPYDLTMHCTGTDCASVTYSLVTVSGTACETASSQFAISMGSMSNDGTEAGSGSCRVQMSYMGDTVLGNIWSWGFGAAPGTDEIAPTIPTGITTTGSEGAVTVNWLASTDSGGEGVKDYLVKKDSATIATVTTGVESGLQLSYTSDEIGTVSGTPSYDVDGHDHSITCEGTGIDTSGSSDSMCVQYAQVTGDFDAQFTIDSLTPSSGSDFHQGGMLVRESLAGNARGLYMYGQYDADGNQRLHVRTRSSQDSLTPTIVNQLLTFRSYRVTRVGDTWTFYHKIASSAEWQEAASVTLALPSQVYVASWVSDNAGTGGASVSMSQVAVNNAPALSHTDNSGTGGSYTVAARDNADNVSADSVAVTGMPGAPPTGSGVKFNPGAYVASFTFGSQPRAPDIFAELCNTTNVEGAQIVMHWGQLESGSTTAGASYTFDALQGYYDTLAACGRRLVLQIARVGRSTNNPGPAYLENESQYDGGTYYNSTYNSTYIKGWVPEVMDRLIALETALATQFDEAEYFEGVIFPETVYGLPVADDFSASAWQNEMKRLISARVDIWPSTNKIVFFNFLNGTNQAGYDAFMAYMEANEAMMGGPDIKPEQLFACAHGSPCATGDPPRTPSDISQYKTTAQKTYVGRIGTQIDYRPLMGCGTAVQPPEMGGKEGNFTPTEIFYESNNSLQCSHTFWWYKTWELDFQGGGGVDEANWNSGGSLESNGLKAFIEAGSANPSGDALTCPENYSAGCQ